MYRRCLSALASEALPLDYHSLRRVWKRSLEEVKEGVGIRGQLITRENLDSRD